MSSDKPSRSDAERVAQIATNLSVELATKAASFQTIAERAAFFRGLHAELVKGGIRNGAIRSEIEALADAVVSTARGLTADLLAQGTSMNSGNA